MLTDDVLDHLRAVADLPDLTGTKYRLLATLGRGGMGTVYRAEDTGLGREVALKVLADPDPAGDLSARLLAEARLLARLEHPNIVPVHDVGTLLDGRVFYAMKLVRGRRLDAWRGDAPGRAPLLRLFRRVCEAVAFAHENGVIHRDLKPENIMVGPFGEALVMDWGVAKALPAGPGATPATGSAAAPPTGGEEPAGPAQEPPGATAHGVVLGTPAYMAPEQARGETGGLDARTDVYALGAILYYLLAGRPPFDPVPPAEVLRRVLDETPRPLRQIDPGIPRPLAAICERAMARGLTDRYPTVLELADEVDRFLDGLPVRAHRETPLERAGRVLGRHRVLAYLVLAYLVMRVIVLFLAER